VLVLPTPLKLPVAMELPLVTVLPTLPTPPVSDPVPSEDDADIIDTRSAVVYLELEARSLRASSSLM